MASAEVPTGLPPLAGPNFDPPNPTTKSSKSTQSAPDSSRRHSLPSHFLPPSLWSKNISSASLVESGEAARGESSVDEASVAHRISALRQLNGATRNHHRYAKSTGARNSTFSQPVIVRTYSGTIRPRSQQRDIIMVKKDNVPSLKPANKVDMKLPPVEAFTFKGIMDEIRQDVSQDLERIAEICARSKYSLANQYEVHMPPHGRGDPFVQTERQSSISTANGSGPTLQAIGSDDEQPRSQGRLHQRRRTKSAAYGTLETIMSSSRSSDEDTTKKKPAAELAEEVRGRAGNKRSASTSPEELVIEPEPTPQRPTRHTRSKSASFATIVIDNALGIKQTPVTQLMSSTSLVSEPARPQTSLGGDFQSLLTTAHGETTVPNTRRRLNSKPAIVRHESTASTLLPGVGSLPTIFENLNSWLPWTKAEPKTASHAEGSLRHLLDSTDTPSRRKSTDHP